MPGYDVAVAKKKLSARAERREAARATEKLGRAREVLARLEPGGAAARPIEVQSASQIEPHATALPCLRCDGSLRLDEHAAVTLGGDRLRLVKLHCALCGTKREAWFRIVTNLPS
jgi:RNase P subunit RPR2